MEKTSRNRRALVAQSLGLAAAAVAAGGAQAAAPAGPYKAVFQISDADPQKWNLTLNNTKNALADLGAGTQLEIVVFGPGIGMVRAGSEVAARVGEAVAAGVKVMVCQNTMRALKLEPKDIHPQAGYVPSGVGELIRKQTEGWAYIRS
jgi:intracellular sulfur oxidation DsrE/DsrF family protein